MATSTTDTMSTQAGQWTLLSMQGFEILKGQAQKFYTEAMTEGETQKKIFTFTRTAVGIASIYYHPEAALFGATLGALTPEYADKLAKFADGAITGFWNSMSPKQKLTLSSLGLAVTYMGYDLFSLPATLFSSKVSAQLAVSNYKKEEIAFVARQAQKSVEQRFEKKE